MDLYRYFV